MTLQDLGRAMKSRRDEIGLKQDDVKAAAGGGISRPKWSQLENGHDGNHRSSTFTAIDRALQWPIGRARSLYEGVDLTPPGDPAADALAELGEAVAALASRLDDEVQRMSSRLDALERGPRR